MGSGTGTCCCGVPCDDTSAPQFSYNYTDTDPAHHHPKGMFVVLATTLGLPFLDPSSSCAALGNREYLLKHVSGAIPDPLVFTRIDTSDGVFADVTMRYHSFNIILGHRYEWYSASIIDTNLDLTYSIFRKWGDRFAMTEASCRPNSHCVPQLRFETSSRVMPEADLMAATFTLDDNAGHSISWGPSEFVSAYVVDGFAVNWRFENGSAILQDRDRFGFGDPLRGCVSSGGWAWGTFKIANIVTPSPGPNHTFLTTRDPLTPFNDTFGAPQVLSGSAPFTLTES